MLPHDVPERHLLRRQKIASVSGLLLVEPPVDAEPEFDEQIQIADAGRDGRPFELDYVPRRQMPPQAGVRRRLVAVELNEDDVRFPRRIANCEVRPHLKKLLKPQS